MNFTLHVWRQAASDAPGKMVVYQARDIKPDMSFLEMLDVVNEGLTERNETPIAFDSDCREGICGMCSLMINGIAHGPMRGTATCQLHMRSFKDGDTIYIKPWRARAFPVIKDLTVDRSAFDRIIQAGGFISAPTGGAQDANNILVPKDNLEMAMDAAACIGCGACVAACPNASASLFTAAKITHLGLLPQGQPERYRRALGMVEQMDLENFGSCTLHGECQEACPKEISIDTITRMNRDFVRASLFGTRS
ncbi:MAG: succinate dehydrogenase/fumarate reductase iron-sulfur subunit [Gemmatimonadaceae bacterium]